MQGCVATSPRRLYLHERRCLTRTCKGFCICLHARQCEVTCTVADAARPLSPFHPQAKDALHHPYFADLNKDAIDMLEAPEVRLRDRDC